MSNFAKEQLKKYGWTEGKGLGKNENGITECIKITRNQDKAGIGYDENDPWWEKLYNNTTEKIKIESHVSEVTLDVAKKTMPFDHKILDSWEKLQNKYSFTKNTEGIITNMSDQKQDEICDRAAYKTKVPYFTLSGKLERIAEQDKILSNVKSLLGAATENMTYRKTNAETDVEESEHEVGNNEIMLPSIEEESTLDVRSKSTRRKHRKRINKLAERLDTCSLEEKSFTPTVLKQDFLNKKLCQKMKKSTEKRMDSNILELFKRYKNEDKSQLFQVVTAPKDDTDKKLYLSPKKKLEILLDRDKRKRLSRGHIFDIDLPKGLSELRRQKNEKDKIEYKADQSPELRNSSEGNEITDKQDKDCLAIDLEAIEEKTRAIRNCVFYKSIIPIGCPSLYLPKLTLSNNCLTHNTEFVSRSNITEGKFYLHSKNSYNKMQKKKNRCRSENIKKITDELRGAVLAHELNSVIKNLTAVGLTDEVSASTIKKRRTQTHLTPV